MIILKRLAEWGILLVLVNFVFPQRVYAYIDPGSGSYVLQLFIAGLLGALYSIKIFWTRIRSFLTKQALPSKLARILKWRD